MASEKGSRNSRSEKSEEMENPLDEEDEMETPLDDEEEMEDPFDEEEDMENPLDEGNSTDQLNQVGSRGFAPPDEDDDPFKELTTGGSGSKLGQVRSSGSAKESTKSKVTVKSGTDSKSVKTVAKAGSVNESNVSVTTGSRKTLRLRQGRSKSRTGMKAAMKSIRASMAHLDREEEKLKLLPDCCHYTANRNDNYEAESGKEMLSSWFSQVNLSPEDQKKLCFAESLLMVEEGCKVAGKMYTTVSQAKWCDRECLCVHSGSFGKFCTGLEAGTTITSFVTPDFKTVQEFVHEWASTAGDKDTIERKTFIITEGVNDDMCCKISVTRNGKTVDSKVTNLGMKERDNLVCEGGNILLQRLLILERRIKGTMNLQCMSYTGKVVKVKYGELGSSWENVKGKQVKTWGIRRTVSLDKEERIWDSLYNKHARLILRCQPEAPMALIPLWFETVQEFDKNGKFTGLYSPYAWACDVELYSKYKIKKEELTHSNRRYLLNHPQVRALLSDYLQALLFRKPMDVVEFTQTYFEGFINPAAKHGRPSRKTVATSQSQFSAPLFDDSSSLAGEYGEGEWLGEEDFLGEEADFYPINPRNTFSGLEKVETEDSEEVEAEEFTEDLRVNEQGEYVPASVAAFQENEE